MAYRLLLDENVEHEVFHRLENFDYDVEHVDFEPTLGKGTDDDSIAQHSKDTNRIIVTHDDDFVLKLDEKDYRAVFYFSDETLSAKQVTEIIHKVSQHYPQNQIHGVEYLSTEWL